MSASKRILVVDDDAGGRLLTRASLAKAGFAVVEAVDGDSALAAVRSEIPDLVLMDVSMPGMDGFIACAELHRIPGAARVPVVMMTGLEDVKSIDRAFEVGAIDFITKPINWTILAHRVRYLLRANAAIEELKQNQRRLSNAQRIGVMGDWEWDVRRNRIVPSAQAWRIFGCEWASTSTDLDEFMLTTHPEDAERLRCAFQRSIENGDSFAIDHRVVQPNGELRHVHQQIEVIERDASGRALQLAGAVHDITRHKNAEEEIRRLAHYDPLTGLPNRLLFTEQLEKAIARAARHAHRLAIMFIDLDRFKRVNDTLGHSAGDELLRAVSARLIGSLRSVDSVMRHPGELDSPSIARLGGDEFILLLSDIKGYDDAAAVARRMVDTLAQPVCLLGKEIFVGGSVGVAMYPEDGTDPDTLLMNADTAMYRAKEAGRGGFRFYDRSMNDRALERLVMDAELRRALERNEFVLHYQPRVDIRTGHIVGTEALIRWIHPVRGLIAPGEFIPVAENSGLIVPIGNWVIGEVCRQNAAWQKAGLPALPVAVNLASSHLRERGLPDFVARTIAANSLSCASLEIEVTESLLMIDPELSVEIATRLSSMGVRLSIDDFGTGYSSLSYLKRLPIHALKIDRSFVRDLATDPDDAAIITAIIAMAHSLKLKVVAEGVETDAQLNFLRSGRCDEYQGFLLSPALNAPAFARLLADLPLHAPGTPDVRSFTPEVKEQRPRGAYAIDPPAKIPEWPLVLQELTK